MYLTRNIEDTIKKFNAERKVLLLLGARQVGKTTLLKHLADDSRTYVSLDDIEVRYFALSEPDLFLKRYEPPIFIDSIQHAPNLLKHIKDYVEREGKIGDIWLASSQKYPLVEDAESIFGDDLAVLDLLGFSVAEMNGYVGKVFLPVKEHLFERFKTGKAMSVKSLYELIWRGSMPGMHNGSVGKWDIYYADYVQTYLMRDVMKMVQLNDEILFYRFLCAAAAQIGKVVNYAELAAAADVSAPTAKKWIKVLEAAGIVYLLPALAPNGAKFAVKAPKLCFLDTGLAAYLLKWKNPEVLEVGASSSAFFESWVIAEICKSYSNEGKVPPLSYYRNFNSQEVELIIEDGETLYPVCIKNTSSPEKAAKVMTIIDSLQEEVKGLKFAEKSVICLTDELNFSSSGTWHIPAWMI